MSQPEPGADRILALERQIAELRLQSGGAQARLKELQEELKSLKGIPAQDLTWQRVQLARHMKRPHSIDYFSRLAPDFAEIHGDRAYGDDPAIVCGYGHLQGEPIMWIGQEKGRDTKAKLHRNFGMPKPEGYRKAMRVMELASKFRRPIVAFLDTPGAYPGIDAEERGQAQAIAINLREMSRLEVPLIVIVIGEGGSGGALALGIGNKVYMMENSVYSVISPESCAAIIYRDASHAQRAAAALKITAPDLLRLGLVDGIIPEPPGGAQEDYDGAALRVGEAVLGALAELRGMSPAQLIEQRYQKFRKMGNFFSEPAV